MTEFIYQLHFKRFEVPERLYRFLDKEEYADEMSQGRFRLTTFQYCREYEKKRQGDMGEATAIFNTGLLTGSSKDPHFRINAAKAGYLFSGGEISNIYMRNNTHLEKTHDAYMLPTSLECNPEAMADTYGKYCVEIKHVSRFLSRLNYYMLDRYSINKSLAGNVHYRTRVHTPDTPFNRPRELIKPEEFSIDKEYRIVFGATDYEQRLERLDIDCPSLASCINRIF